MSNLDLGNNEFINYEFHENSEKPTIVFSNSLGSDLNMWNPQVEFFKNDYQLVLYDKRGHGKVLLFKDLIILICLKMT